MQGRQQVCVLCRSIGRPARSIPHGRREASHLRPLEPYDASKLLLDLDAQDCKYVRNDQKECLIPLPPSAAPKRVEVGTATRKKGWAKRDPRNVPDIYRPADIDFMRYALLDDAGDWSNQSRKGHLWKVLSRCLPLSLGGYEDHIKWLRAYEVLPYKVDKLLQSPHEQAVQGIGSALKDAKGAYEMSRITSLLTRKVEGCKFVASNGVLFLNKTRTGTEETLKYINALIQRLETMGVNAGPQWYRAGLKNALKLAHGPAIKKYTNIAIARKDVLKVPKTVEHTMKWSFDAAGLRRQDNDGDNSKQDDLVKLLTGWEKLGVPEGDEQRKPCIALLVKGDVEMFEAYIDALDKIGAYKALQHEHNHIDSTCRGATLAPSERANV